MTVRDLTTPGQGESEISPDVLELETDGIRLTVVRDGEGAHLITLTPLVDTAWVPLGTCRTGYSTDLIGRIFSLKGAFVCDEIQREENPDYVEKKLRDTILMYVDECAFDGKRILDFGCGCGASSLVFARMFPSAEIVGVELEPGSLDLARLRAHEKGFGNLTFFTSPDPARIPPDLGEFDHVVLSAVFEHMLPAERKKIMPQLWACLKPGGVLFLNQTPNRLYPVDYHTTGLPLINYLPARLALLCARHFSPRVDSSDSWQTLLRRGIRGGTLGSILRSLDADPDAPPCLLSARDPAIGTFADSWLRLTTPRYRTVKKGLRVLFNAVYSLTGLAIVPPELHLAIRKPPGCSM